MARAANLCPVFPGARVSHQSAKGTKHSTHLLKNRFSVYSKNNAVLEEKVGEKNLKLSQLYDS